MTKSLSTLLHTFRYALASAVLALAVSAVSSAPASAATPGQVGKTTRCTAKSVGARGSAFHQSGNSTTVKFKVSGKSGCKVQLSGNSFYAPSMNGKPYNKQVLYKRVTKTYKPGTYSMTVALPPKATSSPKGCYYQVDLTYGIHNVTPVIAYGHGKVCQPKPKPQPKPQAQLTCVSLTKSLLNSDNQTYKFTAKASAKNTTITSYAFNFGDGKTTTVKSGKASVAVSHNYAKNGKTYKVSVAVNSTKKNGVTSAHCVVSFTTPKPTKPTPTPPTPTPTPPTPTTPETPTTPSTPSELPNTGAGDIIGFFSATTIAGGLLHRFFLRRKAVA